MKKKQALVSIMVSIALFTSGCSLLKSDDVVTGVYFENIDLSGQNKEQVSKEIKQFFSNQEKNIILVGQDKKEYKFELTKVGIKADVENTINNAFLFGNEDNITTQLKNRFNALVNHQLIEPVYNVDSVKYNEFITKLTKELGLNEEKPIIDVVEGKVVHPAIESGKIIDKENLLNEIVIHLKENSLKPIIIPYKAGLEKIPHINEIKQMNTILGEYTSYFNTGAVNRSHNVRLATQSISGTYLPPGGIFSYNKVLGERTAAKGYKSAPVFVGTELVPGIGGGICQVSSTLFNSALYAGMDIQQRVNHIEPVGYMPLGQDATVSYGSIDLIFKNPYSHPVYVLAHITGGKLTTYILGADKDKPKSVSITEIDRRVLKYKTEIKIDPALKEEHIKEGEDGLYVSVKRTVVRANGEIKSDVFASDYDSIPEIITKPSKEYILKRDRKEKQLKKEVKEKERSEITKDKQKDKNALNDKIDEKLVKRKRLIILDKKAKNEN